MKVAVRTTERVGKALLDVGIERVRVDGHTDASGKEACNEQLSVRRAKSVAPVATNTTSSGRNGLSLAWTRKDCSLVFYCL
jgi:flagellar motor protein MotB